MFVLPAAKHHTFLRRLIYFDALAIAASGKTSIKLPHSPRAIEGIPGEAKAARNSALPHLQ